MPTPSESTVRRILETNDRDLKIRAAIEQAWVDIQQKYPDRAWWRRMTTLRSVMWEHSVDRVMEVVEADSGLVSIEHYDTASFIAEDTVLFRLKKADRKLLTANFPTPLAGMFHQHDADLFGHEGFHRVEMVHVFNRFMTDVDWVGVVARHEKKRIWDFELRQGDADISFMPIQPTAPKKPAGDTVVRPAVPFGEGQSKDDKN